MNPEQVRQIEIQLEDLFKQLAEQQRAKTIEVAHRIRPDLSEDDLRDPHSFPEVTHRYEWAFEDGILAGIISSQSAVMCELRKLLEEDKSG